MMKKFSLMMTSLMLISMISFSQTTKDHIEKLSKDPKTAQNAAKADVYILKNKTAISDTTRLESDKKPASKISRKKKRHCNHKG